MASETEVIEITQDWTFHAEGLKNQNFTKCQEFTYLLKYKGRERLACLT